MGLFQKVVGAAIRHVFDNPAPPSVAQARTRNQKAWNQASHSPIYGYRYRVARIVDETPDTRSLWLEAEGERLPNWQAGQFVTCCISIDGQPLKRAYSISSAPNEGFLRLTIKRLKTGQVSSYLHTRINEGDTLTLLGPSGQFTLDQHANGPLLMIGGGSGITPLRALIAEQLQRYATRPITLIAAFRSEADIIFKTELDALRTEHPQLNVEMVLSQPSKHWKGPRGRLTDRSVKSLVGTFAPDTQAYLCGPEALMALARHALMEQGLAHTQIHEERFQAAGTRPLSLSETPHAIQFESTGKTITAEPGQTLLEAALTNDIPLEYSCQVGGCGHCRVRVLEGEVIESTPNCLSESERAAGYRLACCSYANAPLRITQR